ncbi:lipid-A-disaccharide synthase [Candidatus Riflebacteria bacterium]
MTHNKSQQNEKIRCMILAGEASGDMHGGNLARELFKKFGPKLELFGFGGPHLRQAGAKILHDISDLAMIGFIEVIKNYWKLRRYFKELEEIFEKNPPDFLILIDYPGFNVQIAKLAKRYKIPVFYYICPQVWAWNRGRVHSIVKIVDKIIAVFPFEVKIWREAGADVDYFGHPLLEVVNSIENAPSLNKIYGIKETDLVLSILPGSREQEIFNMLPVMLEAIEKLQHDMPNLRAFLPLAANIDKQIISPILENARAKLQILDNSTYEILTCSDIAIVASGTATLETAILTRPMIIVYKTTFLNWLISKFLLTLNHIGLPNILAGRKIVPEYIQGEFNSSNIYIEAKKILTDKRHAQEMQKELLKIKETLGEVGASAKIASSIHQFMTKKIGHKFSFNPGESRLE